LKLEVSTRQREAVTAVADLSASGAPSSVYGNNLSNYFSAAQREDGLAYLFWVRRHLIAQTSGRPWVVGSVLPPGRLARRRLLPPIDDLRPQVGQIL
jgi:hypothetical protein